MRIVIHDFVGHPFQASLSRVLALRGHEVSHIYFADNLGPKGLLSRQQDDAESLRFIGIKLHGSVDHAAGTGAQTGMQRRRSDIAYGRKIAAMLRGLRPNVVLSGNTPTDTQRAIIKVCKELDARFVYWLQDVYSMGVSKLLTKKLGYVGAAIGWYYQRQDKRQFRVSDAIVAISDDFTPLAAAWAGSRAKVQVIENWMTLDDVPVRLKQNAWAHEHGLDNSFNFIYTGTLGRKHNPGILARLARWCRVGETVVVVGQGYSIPQLIATKAAEHLDDLKLLPLQPIARYADVLATADVLVAIIDEDSGTFAVPSKVLAYLCAGRPILLSAPKANLAARTVLRANAGLVVDPADDAGFLSAAEKLRNDAHLRTALGANGRNYAAQTFDLSKIADRFEDVLIGGMR